MIRKAREMQSLLQFDGETPLDVKWIVFGRVRINVRSTREGGREGRGKRVGNWEMPQGAIAKLREWGVNHVTVVVCRMHEFDSNREPGNRIRGFHAFWIRPATPDSFPFTSPLITPTGHRHLTRYNCSLVPFNVEIEGREQRKKRNDFDDEFQRIDLISLRPPYFILLCSIFTISRSQSIISLSEISIIFNPSLKEAIDILTLFTSIHRSHGITLEEIPSMTHL